MSHCPSLNSARSFCQQEDRGPNSQASALRSIIHTQLASRDRREQRSESGQASDLGLGTLPPELPVCSGIMSVVRACQFSYERLQHDSGDWGSKQDSNSSADVGDLISSPGSSTRSGVSVGDVVQVVLGPLCILSREHLATLTMTLVSEDMHVLPTWSASGPQSQK